MTIYSTLLGEEFERLHPKLQHRYALPLHHTFFAKGTMTEIQSGSRWLSPFYRFASKLHFLFPDSGKDIPFKIANKSFINESGEVEISWKRTFFFPEVERQFNAQMTVDLDKQIVKDYLGDRPLFYSDLLFKVTQEGFLMITSGTQKLVLGKTEVPIPHVLEGRVTVLEGYDDVKNMYTIHVSIYNSLVGRIMMYAGEFTESAR